MTCNLEQFAEMVLSDLWAGICAYCEEQNKTVGSEKILETVSLSYFFKLVSDQNILILLSRIMITKSTCQITMHQLLLDKIRL